MSKGQVDIISAIIIVLIALGLFSTVYIWGVPQIQKRQDTLLLERVNKMFDRSNENSLPKKIEAVANRGSEITFTSDVEGAWFLFPNSSNNVLNNSILFTFPTTISDVGVDCPEGSGKPCDWIAAFGSGSGCGISAGIIGADNPSVVCKKAGRSGTKFNVTYRLWFRELDVDPVDPSTQGYKIILSPRYSEGPFSSSTKSLRISRGEIKNCPASECGKNLIITEVKILFG